MRRCRPGCATSSANQKLDAASLIDTQAPQIIRAFDEGAADAGNRRRARGTSLGGLVYGLTCGRPEPNLEAVPGAPAIRCATLTVTVDETDRPLS